jgi:hypothetical protein
MEQQVIGRLGVSWVSAFIINGKLDPFPSISSIEIVLSSEWERAPSAPRTS